MKQQTALRRIRDIAGPAGWIDSEDGMAPYLREWRGRYHGRATAVVCPDSAATTSKIVRLCRQAGIGIVPQAGNTGVVGGAAPDTSGAQIILSVRRMQRIREIDPPNNCLTAEAGCILARVQEAALEADRFFPLSLVAEGSCMIGGNLATNAGGLNVLRYGNMRDLTLGLEVVLADGSIWQGLSKLRKDNSSLDLKHLFIGSEGALGIITAAVLKLYPREPCTVTALAALQTPEQALELSLALQHTGDRHLCACEIIGRGALELVLEHIPECRDPFEHPWPWYLLAEYTTGSGPEPLQEPLLGVLAAARQQGGIQDAVIAQSGAQRDALWRLRESIPEAQRLAGASIKHDVSVPPAAVPALIRQAGEAAGEMLAGARICAFGHLGDGNIHFNLSQPRDAEPEAFLHHRDAVNARVFGIVHELGGSIAAEHGIGQLKRSLLADYKDPVELDLLRRLKQALDPAGIMNPGKLIP